LQAAFSRKLREALEVALRGDMAKTIPTGSSACVVARNEGS
jgi:hypothetical protein